jgi:hypothetical protein
MLGAMSELLAGLSWLEGDQDAWKLQRKRRNYCDPSIGTSA